MNKRISYLLLLMIFPLFLFAQEDENSEDPCKQSMDKKVEKEFKKGRDLQKAGKKGEAYEIYADLLDEYPDYLELNYYYALGYYLPIEMDRFEIKNKKQAEDAVAAFKRINAVCPEYKIQHNLYAARLAYFMEDFSEAIQFAEVFIDHSHLVKKPEDMDEALLIVRKSKFFDRILNNPVPFDPKPITGISTQHDEYLAALSPDGEEFYFTRRQPYENPNDPFFESGEEREFFSISRKKSNRQFEQGTPLPYPFNQSTNEGSPTINLSNDYLIFSRMNIVQGAPTYRNYDLYYSEWIDGEWTEAKSLGSNINCSDSWESQPSLSSDGKLLFFASDRSGGYGASDIWYAIRQPDGSWGKAQNIGPKINTEGNERSPFLHTDSKTLYFASSGHDGIGGLDIFYAKVNEKNEWDTPVNIGYPINSEHDEVDFFVSLDGKTGYFSSNKIGKSGERVNNSDWNVYQFDLYEEARPQNMIIIKGEVQVEDHDFSGTIVEIRDTASQVIATTSVNEYSGKYAIATELKEEQPTELIINVKKEGHAFDTKLISTDKIIDNVVTSDAKVEKVEVGKTYDLHDIYFGTNLYSLTSNSKQIINLFVEFLNENPSIKVEIQGHTDNIGNDQANQLLSERRAKSVYDYILSKGIDSERIRYKGYGEDLPIATNDTPEGRAKNRRTIFLIYE